MVKKVNGSRRYLSLLANLVKFFLLFCYNKLNLHLFFDPEIVYLWLCKILIRMPIKIKIFLNAFHARDLKKKFPTQY